MDSILSSTEYRELADFRHQIRSFLHFSESAALAEGLEPRQHQALLAIKAAPDEQNCTIRNLAESLFLQHQSAVGLVDRMEARDLIRRAAHPREVRGGARPGQAHGRGIISGGVTV